MIMKTNSRWLFCTILVVAPRGCVFAGPALDALAAYMLNVTARVAAEPPPTLSDFDNRLTRLLAESQALAEAGRYRDAAQKLRQLQVAPPLPNVILPKYIEEWTRDRLAALKQLEQGVDVASLRAFYLEANPRWFRQRTHPIMAAWRAPASEELARLRLVAELLGEAADARGHRLALLALVETGRLSPGDTAEALLTAGNRAHEEKESAAAMAAWERVVDGHPGTSPWFMALFNLGVAHREARDYQIAMGDFTRLIESNPPNREPAADLMQTFRNYAHQAALQISDCHEALGDIPAALHWAQFASDKYRLESWCGNCAAASAEEMAKRIARLKANATAKR